MAFMGRNRTVLKYLFLASILTLTVIMLRGPGNSARAAVLGPSSAGDVVSLPANLIRTGTAACGTDAEVEFFGLSVPTSQVLMITGFYFSASSSSGSDTVEAGLYVTDGNNLNRRSVAPLSGISGSSRLYSGLNAFPVPVPLFSGNFTHLCWSPRTGTLNTSASPWLFGFFAPNQ